MFRFARRQKDKNGQAATDAPQRRSGGGNTVEIGDRFSRTGQPSKVYVVTRIDQRSHHPPHARLTALTSAHEEITIAVNTLLDRRYFMPGPPEPPAWRP